EFRQLGLVVPRIELCRPAVHVQIDDRLGFGREVRKPRQRQMHLHRRVLSFFCGSPARHQRQRRSTEPHARRTEELATREEQLLFKDWMHMTSRKEWEPRINTDKHG